VSCLLYCIFRTKEQSRLPSPCGVGGQHISVVAHNGLSAALSDLTQPNGLTTLSGILAYETVVESFYRDQTVIPVRYGCLLEDSSEAIELLEKNLAGYSGLLGELEGLGEMGVRILLEGSETGPERDNAPCPSGSLPFVESVGARYVAARREHYARLYPTSPAWDSVAERFSGSLSRLSVRHKLELPNGPRKGILSLYFLVPRAAVEAFRQAVREVQRAEPIKLLLSGPWPPYSFVDALS
jgi:gas vesicle protein GvpL/GvpF